MRAANRFSIDVRAPVLLKNHEREHYFRFFPEERENRGLAGGSYGRGGVERYGLL
jgi:hypothetical protein